MMRWINEKMKIKCGLLVGLGLCAVWRDSFLTAHGGRRVALVREKTVRIGTPENLTATEMPDTATRLQSLNVSAILQSPPDRCVSIKFWNHNETFSVPTAIEYLWQSQQGYCSDLQQHPPALEIGLVFVEHAERFWSLSKGYFHYFHFIEFLAVAFEELHRLSGAAACRSAGFHVPWIYHPYMTQKEICGVAGGLNCLAADLILQSGAPSEVGSSHPTTSVFDFSVNDPATASFVNTQREALRKPIIDSDDASPISLRVADSTQAVMIIDRDACVDHQLHKMWSQYLDDFPANQWQANVQASLAKRYQEQNVPPIEPGTLVVSYVDRQASSRRLPDDYHEWILQAFGNHPGITFLHLRMEEYEPAEQVQLAARSHVWMGAHGNGLTHAVWMPPKSRVVEFFWDFSFHFDYATTAELMGHMYMGIFNGKVVDPERVKKHDKGLRKMNREVRMSNYTSLQQDVEAGKRSLLAFVENGIPGILKS